MIDRIEDDGARIRLGFPKAVAEYILPVFRANGFVCTKSTLYMAKFQSPSVEATITHDRLSYEIEIFFERKADPMVRFTLTDILNATLGADHMQQTVFQASNVEDVAWCVEIIAENLEQCDRAIFNGEPTTYRRIEEAARAQNMAYTKQVVQDPIRREAEDALKNHDYAKVRDLYRSIESDLTSLEKKRLKYAESHR